MPEFEDVNDALIAVVKALGGSKQVGPMLWPDRAPDAAQRQLLDCLNPDRPAHLTPGQTLLLLRLARQRGYHAAMDWLVSDLGYLPTAPRQVDDEVAELQRQFVAGVAALQELAGRLQALPVAVAPSAAPAPAHGAHGGGFAPGAFGVGNGARVRAVGGV